MDSKNDSSSSASPSFLIDLEQDLPTTRADVEALRRARDAGRLENPLRDLRRWQIPAWLRGQPDRRTSEGWEPFEL